MNILLGTLIYLFLFGLCWALIAGARKLNGPGYEFD